jgi:hypothetical protein
MDHDMSAKKNHLKGRKMVRHIVMWRLKENAHGNHREVNAKIIKEKLESLNGKIEGMLKLEVGFDYARVQESSDIVLYSEFVTRKDLENYQVHPLHKAAVEFIREARSERRVVDYEF